MADRSFAPVNVVMWTNILRGIYEKFPSMTALWYVLYCTHGMWNEAAKVRLKIDDTIATSQTRHLVGPMKELSRFNSRLLFYFRHINDPPEDVKRFVLDPLLYGRFDPDFPEPLFEPTWTKRADGWVITRSDVTQVAMVRNQFVAALEYYRELWAWWRDIMPWNRLAEFLMVAKQEAFGKSAPGELPTLREEVAESADEMVENTKDMFKTAGTAGIFGVAVLAVAGLTFAALHAAD
jgi:hypothetical protein